MTQTATPEQAAEMQRYQDERDLAATEWRSGKGGSWAERNPVSVAETDQSFMRRYGRTKSWIVRDALRDVPREAVCLEIGCSSGAHLALLASLGFGSTYGVDISLDALRRAPAGSCAQADAWRLPFADASVDLVTTAGSFMHFGPADRMKDSAKELDRVARRWLLFVELWADRPHFVSFGDLLPPCWLFPWHETLPAMLDGSFQPTYHQVYDLVVRHEGLRAPMCVTLFERA